MMTTIQKESLSMLNLTKDEPAWRGRDRAAGEKDKPCRFRVEVAGAWVSGRSRVMVA